MTEREARAIRKVEGLTGLKVHWFPEKEAAAAFNEQREVIAQGRGKTVEEACQDLRTDNLMTIRRRKLREGKGRCNHCGGGGPLQLHHVEFRSQGGTDHPDNLDLICIECHNKAHGLR